MRLQVARGLADASAPSIARREAERIVQQLADSWALPAPSRKRIVDAVQPNVGVEMMYRQRLTGLLDTANQELHTLLANTPLPKIGFAHDDAKSPVGVLSERLKIWGRRMIRNFDKMSGQIAKEFATESKQATEYATQQAFKRAGWTVKFTPTPKSVAAYQSVIGENVALIRSVGQKFHTDVESQVWNAVRKGGDLHSLSVGLQKTYGVSARRAAFIARDQSAKAKAIMQAVRDQELGIKQAVWHHSHAGETPRPTHLRMNGKLFNLSEGMYDADVGEKVWPGQLPNCRCTYSSVIEGFEM